MRLLPLAIMLSMLLSCAGPSPRYSSLGSKSDRTSVKKGRSTSKDKAAKKSSEGKAAKKSRKSNLTGEASWYGPGFHGKTTANGEKYNMYAMTAAHRTLPFGTIVEVINLDTNKKVKVRINDRGPYAKGRKYMQKRIIDVSKKAAKKLGMLDKGHARIKLRIIK